MKTEQPVGRISTLAVLRKVSPFRASEADQDDLRSGSGWSLIDAAQFAGLPGVHDLGTLLGVTTGSLLLVILRAAERWVPGEDRLGEKSAIVRREGHVLVERTDGSSHTLKDDVELITNPWSLAAAVNVGTELAEVLVISR
jgi:hypothetical protein